MSGCNVWAINLERLTLGTLARHRNIYIKIGYQRQGVGQDHGSKQSQNACGLPSFKMLSS